MAVTTSDLGFGLVVLAFGVGLASAARASPREARFVGVAVSAGALVAGAGVVVAGVAAGALAVAFGLRAPTSWTAPTPPPTSSAPTTAAEATALIRLPRDLR